MQTKLHGSKINELNKSQDTKIAVKWLDLHSNKTHDEVNGEWLI